MHRRHQRGGLRRHCRAIGAFALFLRGVCVASPVPDLIPGVPEGIGKGAVTSAQHRAIADAYADQARVAGAKMRRYVFRANRYLEPGRVRRLESRRRCLEKARAYGNLAREARRLSDAHRRMAVETERAE